MKNPDPLQKQYRDYFDLITGRCQIEKSPLASMVQFGENNSLPVYQSDYLNDQILNWGGVIKDIFPETCQILKEEKIALEEFVLFFYQTSLPLGTPYDFFKIKLDRFKTFIREISIRLAPAAKDRILAAVKREYHACWEAYRTFNPAD